MHAGPASSTCLGRWGSLSRPATSIDQARSRSERCTSGSGATAVGVELSDPQVVQSMIDEIPLLAALATVAAGPTYIRNAAELRGKDTDRITSTVSLLGAFGCRASATEDGLIVHPGSPRAVAPVNLGGDHRLVFAAMVLAVLCGGDVELRGVCCGDIACGGPRRPCPLGTCGVPMSTTPYVLVSGGAGHLGSAIVEKLMQTRSFPVVVDRATPARPGVPSLEADLVPSASVTGAVTTLLSQYGAPAGLVLCHGWSPKAEDGNAIAEVDMSAELFSRVLDTNLTSCFLLLQGLLPAMAESGGGRVVVVGSAAAHTVAPTRRWHTPRARPDSARWSAYSLCDTRQQESLLNDVSPGKIAHRGWPDSAETIERYRQEIPVGRLADPEDVAEVITFLISEKNTYLTGQSVIVDGGRLA